MVNEQLENENKPPNEELGKTLEAAVCHHLMIEYNGKFKYSTEKAHAMSAKLKLIEVFPLLRDAKITHTAKGGGRYDYTVELDGEISRISAKSNYKHSEDRVAPQKLAQVQPLLFNQEVFKDKYIDNYDLKRKIQMNAVHVAKYMERLPFDCPIVYYVKSKDEYSLIKRTSPFCYDGKVITWSRSYDKWKNSSLLKMDGTNVMEFQFHSKNRTNVAVRWYMMNTVNVFPKHFKIIPI